LLAEGGEGEFNNQQKKKKERILDTWLNNSLSRFGKLLNEIYISVLTRSDTVEI
jgi:hypothetical protein